MYRIDCTGVLERVTLAFTVLHTLYFVYVQDTMKQKGHTY